MLVTLACLLEPTRPRSPSKLEVDIRPIKLKSAKKHLATINGPDFAPGKVPMDVLMVGQLYVERIRALVEPVWRQRLMRKVQYYKQISHDLPQCTTNLLVRTTASGSYISIEVLQSCTEDASFDAEATEAFKYLGALPPPPKSLLEHGVLDLWWNFELH